jgi:hypothetical protein
MCSKIDQKIDRICLDDSELLRYCGVAKESGWTADRALVVGLVHRAFVPAWNLVNHPGLIYNRPTVDIEFLLEQKQPVPPQLLYREPLSVMREYLYPHHDLSDHIINMSREDLLFTNQYFIWAEGTFLGEPGTAARFYRLLP